MVTSCPAAASARGDALDVDLGAAALGVAGVAPVAGTGRAAAPRRRASRTASARQASPVLLSRTCPGATRLPSVAAGSPRGSGRASGTVRAWVTSAAPAEFRGDACALGRRCSRRSAWSRPSRRLLRRAGRGLARPGRRRTCPSTGRSLLDVGGGPGYFADAFEARGATYVPLDADAGEMRAARPRARARARCWATARRCPSAPARFDVAYSCNVAGARGRAVAHGRRDGAGDAPGRAGLPVATRCGSARGAGTRPRRGTTSAGARGRPLRAAPTAIGPRTTSACRMFRITAAAGAALGGRARPHGAARRRAARAALPAAWAGLARARAGGARGGLLEPRARRTARTVTRTVWRLRLARRRALVLVAVAFPQSPGPRSRPTPSWT